MKLTVLNWFKDFIIQFIGRSIEIIFRVILFFLPLGVFLTILQNRKKVSKISNISVYTTDQSVWQHIFPGFILVAVDPTMFQKTLDSLKGNVQNWIKDNKYLLAMLFMTAIVVIMLWRGI